MTPRSPAATDKSRRRSNAHTRVGRRRRRSLSRLDKTLMALEVLLAVGAIPAGLLGTSAMITTSAAILRCFVFSMCPPSGSDGQRADKDGIKKRGARGAEIQLDLCNGRLPAVRSFADPETSSGEAGFKAGCGNPPA